MLEFCDVNDLMICNTNFKENSQQLDHLVWGGGHINLVELCPYQENGIKSSSQIQSPSQVKNVQPNIS